jgi:serine/threonine protein kinase
LRLIDFGEAMLVEDDASYEEMTGTFHFCAPEVFDPPFTGATLFKTDVWSFGVSLFLLITGVPPFDGPHDHAVRKAARKGKYSWPDTVKPSASLVDLVAQCLQLNPALRPSTEQLLAHQWFADMVAAAQDEDYRDIVFSDATAESLLAFAASRQFQRALEKLLHSVQKHSATRRRTLSTETSPVRSRSSSSVDVSHAHHRQVSSSPNQSRRSSLLLPPTSGADEVWDDNSFKPRSRSTLV